MSKYSIAHIDEIDVIDDGRAPFRPIRHHLGIRSFGVNAWTAAKVGDRIINEHDEDEPDDHEELYVVQRGRARFEIDGESVDAPAGSYVLVQPGAKRTAFSEEPETTILAIGSTPGKAYEAFGWEIWAPLNRYYHAGRYEEAADRGLEIIEANPQYPGPLYNLACCESLAGRKDDAIRHLRQAIEQADQFRAYAAGDSDFDAIRDEPDFQALVGRA